MIFETFKLSDVTECDYESYAFTMTVGDLMESSHSSNIQRIRNKEKEIGIMKFIKKHIDNNKSPFFQPFILHYSGKVLYNEGKYLLDPQPNFSVQIKDENGNESTQLFKFEVIDGNGRLNAMIRLQQAYIEKILSLTNELKQPDITEKRAKRVKKQIEDLKIKNKTLKSTTITVQLYLNLNEESKKSLFSSVNQSEPMSKGRLEVYSEVKSENKLLHDYLIHTASLEDFNYEISVDKDIVRTQEDRMKYIPSVYLIPTFKKATRYYKGNLEEYKEELFRALDKYISNVSDYKMLKKQYLSLLGNVISESHNYKEDTSYFTEKMAKLNINDFPDIARYQKATKLSILEAIFKDGNKIEENNSNQEELHQLEVAFTC